MYFDIDMTPTCPITYGLTATSITNDHFGLFLEFFPTIGHKVELKDVYKEIPGIYEVEVEASA